MRLPILALLVVSCIGCVNTPPNEQPATYVRKPIPESAIANLESMIGLRLYPITEIQHENTSPDIGLIVSPKWHELSTIDKEDMAIQIRNKWAAECECGAFTILFGTSDGVILGRISTLGKPHFD